jgi:hypothetical protein
LPPPTSAPDISDEQRLVPLTDDAKFLSLEEEFPEAAVSEVYKDIERLLFQIGDI